MLPADSTAEVRVLENHPLGAIAKPLVLLDRFQLLDERQTPVDRDRSRSRPEAAAAVTL